MHHLSVFRDEAFHGLVHQQILGKTRRCREMSKRCSSTVKRSNYSLSHIPRNWSWNHRLFPSFPEHFRLRCRNKRQRWTLWEPFDLHLLHCRRHRECSTNSTHHPHRQYRNLSVRLDRHVGTAWSPWWDDAKWFFNTYFTSILRRLKDSRIMRILKCKNRPFGCKVWPPRKHLDLSFKPVSARLKFCNTFNIQTLKW